MFTPRDHKLWRKYLAKLMELGITDICRDADLEAQEKPWHFMFAAKYGSVPVTVMYVIWTRMSPGMVAVHTDRHNKPIIVLTALAESHPDPVVVHTNLLAKIS